MLHPSELLNPLELQRILVARMAQAISDGDINEIDAIANISDIVGLPLFTHQVVMVSVSTDDCREYLEDLMG